MSVYDLGYRRTDQCVYLTQTCVLCNVYSLLCNVYHVSGPDDENVTEIRFYFSVFKIPPLLLNKILGERNLSI